LLKKKRKTNQQTIDPPCFLFVFFPPPSSSSNFVYLSLFIYLLFLVSFSFVFFFSLHTNFVLHNSLNSSFSFLSFHFSFFLKQLIPIFVCSLYTIILLIFQLSWTSPIYTNVCITPVQCVCVCVHVWIDLDFVFSIFLEVDGFPTLFVSIDTLERIKKTKKSLNWALTILEAILT